MMRTTVRTTPASKVPSEKPCLTIGKLRRLIDSLPADTPIIVGVRDGHRFNALLGELPVRGGSVFAGGPTPTLMLSVAGLS